MLFVKASTAKQDDQLNAEMAEIESLVTAVVKKKYQKEDTEVEISNQVARLVEFGHLSQADFDTLKAIRQRLLGSVNYAQATTWLVDAKAIKAKLKQIK